MKTHDYRPYLAMLAAACSLVACGRSTPPESSAATETSAAPAPAETAAPVSRSAIVPGLYHVCKVDPGAQVHDHQVGDHVPNGTAVFIRPIDPVTGTTLLCIGEACPDDPTLPSVQDQVFWMSGDLNRVQTVKEFGHKRDDAGSNPPAIEVRHLVQLMAETEDDVPKTDCPGKNVHLLRFCEWGQGEEGPTWLCEGAQPHAGAVHLEP